MIDIYLIKDPGSLTIQKTQRLRIDFNDPSDRHYEIMIGEGCTPQLLAQEFYYAALDILEQFGDIKDK